MFRFPDQHIKEASSPHLRARAEGRVLEMSVFDKLCYVWKYLFSPKLTAPADVMEHFSSQKRVLRELRQIEKGVRLGFFGDLMWIRKNWENYLNPVRENLGNYDGLVGNLETVVAPSLPVPEFWPDYFTYNAPAALLTSFPSPKLAALSFANNHVLDRGDQGARETLALLDQLNITHSGLGEKGSAATTSFTRGGISFGFYAGAFGLNDPRLLEKSELQLNLVPGLSHGEEMPDLTGVERALREMRSDIKIVYLHWGHEFEFYPTARQLRIARAIVAAGADILVGSGSHVPQPSEVIAVNDYPLTLPEANRLAAPGPARKALVVYSLGNFASAMYGSHCRLALLQGVTFFHREGRVDWGGLTREYFYNQNRAGGRELIPWPMAE